jgi:hypothetical protein
MAWSDRAIAIESLVMLAAARIFVKTTKGRNLVSRIGGKPIHDSEEDMPAMPSGPSARVGAMVERIARATWWRSMCLEKALAGKWMLQRRGIPSTMYVGMARRDGEFVAHAWLVGEGQTVTGGSKIAYAPLAAFGETADIRRRSRPQGPGQP